jgi:hypothetical protein
MSIFECLLCGAAYSFEDARKGNYYVQTRICKPCYVKGMAVDVTVWCFGKKSVFSSKRIECTKLCPDREICRHFITGAVHGKARK